MHRLIVVALKRASPDRFLVTADSSRPEISDQNPVPISAIGGTHWGERHRTPGYSAPAASIPLPSAGTITSLSYWVVRPTRKVLVYDFGKAGLSERKVVVDGELHVEYADRHYVAKTGDTMLFLTDPSDCDSSGSINPFVVRFLSESESVVAYADFAVAEPALSVMDELARTHLGLEPADE